VHALVSTNERTPFRSRTLFLDFLLRIGIATHEEVTCSKETHLVHSGPSRERVRHFSKYLAHENTDREARIRPQGARFVICARSLSSFRKLCSRLQLRLKVMPSMCVRFRQNNHFPITMCLRNCFAPRRQSHSHACVVQRGRQSAFCGLCVSEFALECQSRAVLACRYSG